MQFRILKNEDHYIIQKKFLFFWLTVNNIDWNNKFEFGLFKRHAIRFSTLLNCEHAIEEYIRYYTRRKKTRSKYTQVNSKVCSKLYNVLNGEE